MAKRWCGQCGKDQEFKEAPPAVVAWENSHVEAWENSHVVARGNSHVEAWENSHVEARENSHVVARGNSHVEAWGNSHVVARENSHVEAWENSHVEAWGNSHVVARGNSHVVARENSHVEAWENSHVEAWGNSHVVARENSHVEAWGNSHVVAGENSHVSAFSAFVVIIVCALTVVAKGGIIVNHYEQSTNVAVWAEMCQVERTDTGDLLLYKRTGANFETRNGIRYEPGTNVGAPDWNRKHECGGGLHFCPTAAQCDQFRADGQHYVACAVKPVDVVIHARPEYPDKVKAKKCVVLYECDRNGKRIEVEATA